MQSECVYTAAVTCKKAYVEIKSGVPIAKYNLDI